MFPDSSYQRGYYKVWCKEDYHSGERLVPKGGVVWIAYEARGGHRKVCDACYPRFVAEREAQRQRMQDAAMPQTTSLQATI